MPAVSVIVPVYNKERYVARAVASVRAQTFSDYALLLIDDGSTDGSRAVCAGLLGPDDRLLCQPNRGPGAARNAGFRAARGTFVATLDADDTWHPEHLERMVGCARRFPEVGAVFCGLASLPSGRRTIPAEAVLPGGAAEGVVPSWFRAKLHGYFQPSAFLADRARLLAIGLPLDDLRCWEDAELFGRLALHYPLGFVREVLAWYHEGADGRLLSRPNTAYPPFVRTLRRALAAGRVPDGQRRDAREYLAKMLLLHAEHLLAAGQRLRALDVLLVDCPRSEVFAARHRRLLARAFLPGPAVGALRALWGKRAAV